jgi:hypothetical protein
MALLSVPDFRLHVTTELDSAAIQLLLDAAEQAINLRYGVEGVIEEVATGGFSYVFLRWPASAIESISETDGTTTTVLDMTDYRLSGDGVSLRRLDTGTNPLTYWGRAITVRYAPQVPVDERKRVQLALVKLEMNTQHGLSQQTIGSWSESYGQSADSYAEQREIILDSLLHGRAPGFA